MVHIAEHATNLIDGRAALPGQYPWSCTRYLFAETGWAVETARDQFRAPTEISMSKHTRDAHVMDRDMVLLACGLLATAPEVAEVKDSPGFQAMNRGRSYGKLPPIASVHRVLNVGRKVYVGRKSGPPTGREMPYGTRRETFRTYRSDRYVNLKGQTRPVKGAVIRADKAPADGVTLPTFYHVTGQVKGDPDV